MKRSTAQRIAAFPLVRLLLIVAIFAVLLWPIAPAMRLFAGTWRSLAIAWFPPVIFLAVVIAVERFAAGRLPSAIGLDPRHAPRDLVLGGLLGAVLFSLVVLELAFGGFYRIVATHATWALAVAAPVLLGHAFLEELLFRGVIFRLIQEWAGMWVALAISAVLFGLAHAANPGATWISSLAIALEAGVLLGAAFVLTRNLWFPVGLHFAWNFFEGPVYGTQISGGALRTSAITAQITGPQILTGGSFGPEAGLAAVVTCLIAAIALLVLATRSRAS
jgi:membrane protease YdiL (CAAX protease family)